MKVRGIKQGLIRKCKEMKNNEKNKKKEKGERISNHKEGWAEISAEPLSFYIIIVDMHEELRKGG